MQNMVCMPRHLHHTSNYSETMQIRVSKVQKNVYQKRLQKSMQPTHTVRKHEGPTSQTKESSLHVLGEVLNANIAIGAAPVLNHMAHKQAAIIPSLNAKERNTKNKVFCASIT